MRCSTATAWSTAPESGATAPTARRCRQAPIPTTCGAPKGEFKLGNGRYCYPLTVSDHAARYLLLREAFESTREAPVIAAFQRLFRDRGLPVAIRSDNGLPFASPNGLYNLSRLSVWWLRLGIAIERIKPGHPQQNGRHERMHLTLKKEATRPPGLNSLQQQARFDAFVREFNAERPHEALAMRCPAEFYTASPRPYDGLPELQYPWHDRDILVTACGRICMHRKKINISTVLAGQKLGIREVDDGIWLVSFMHYDLGYIDLEQRTLQTIDNPFGTRLSPMDQEVGGSSPPSCTKQINVRPGDMGDRTYLRHIVRTKSLSSLKPVGIGSHIDRGGPAGRWFESGAARGGLRHHTGTVNA